MNGTAIVMRVFTALSQPLVLVRQWLAVYELDRTAIFAGASKVWMMFSGMVTLVLIASVFTPEMQGYYFTFYSFVALQVFAELGMGNVLIQFASHEWVKLEIDHSGKVMGEVTAKSRLASLLRFIFVWYSAGAVVLIPGLGLGGWVFFSRSPAANVSWLLPWLFLSTVTGLFFLAQGVLFFLEGCNQVAFVYRYRLIQAVLGSLALWVAIFLGAGLWTVAVPAAVGLVLAMVMVFKQYGPFLKSLFGVVIADHIKWKREIWPFQWKIAVSWMSGYFMFALFNPILFHYHGSVVAGQMGLTLAVTGTIPWMGYYLIQPRIPQIGMMVAARNYGELDRFFRRLCVIALSISLLGCGAVLIGVYGLYAVGSGYSSRILPPLATGLLLLVAIPKNVVQLQSVYLRAHKKEPLMWLSVVVGLLMGLSAWQLGYRYAALGVTCGYLAITLFVELPISSLIFICKRKEWHDE